MADRLVTGDGREVDLKDQQRISVRNRAINSPINVSDNLKMLSTVRLKTALHFPSSPLLIRLLVWHTILRFVISSFENAPNRSLRTSKYVWTDFRWSDTKREFLIC